MVEINAYYAQNNNIVLNYSYITLYVIIIMSTEHIVIERNFQ